MAVKRRRWVRLVTTAIIPLLTPCSARAASPAPPIDAALKTKIDADVRALLSATHSQAATIAVIVGGKIVYIRGYGLRDVAKALPADARTHYEIGSITKQFTAAAIRE